MAGRKHAARTGRMRLRYESEPDPGARLIWAYDWLRFELSHLARSRTPGARDETRQLALDIAADLAERARQISTRDGDAS